MRKRLIVAMAVVALIGLGALFFLQSYKLPLIHSIVLNALLQKAPPDYSTTRIEETFRTAFGTATKQGREDAYLAALLELSQRLEKIQRLESQDVDEILSGIHSQFAAE